MWHTFVFGIICLKFTTRSKFLFLHYNFTIFLHPIPTPYSYTLSTLLLSLTPHHCLKALNFVTPMVKTKQTAKKSQGGLAPCVNLRGGAGAAPGIEEMEVCPEFQHNEVSFSLCFIQLTIYLSSTASFVATEASRSTSSFCVTNALASCALCAWSSPLCWCQCSQTTLSPSGAFVATFRCNKAIALILHTW